MISDLSLIEIVLTRLFKIISPQKQSKKQKMNRFARSRRSTILSPARYIHDCNRHAFAALILIGCLLAFVAGYVNAVCVVNTFRLPLTAVTGSTAKMAIVLSQGRVDVALHFFLLIFSFILGNAISGALVGGSSFRIQRPYGLVLILESLTLTFGSLFEDFHLSVHSHWEDLSPSAYLVCLGCGLQNGMCTTFSGAVIRTTHVTGTVTDIGLIIGQAIFHQRTRKHLWKLKILIPLYICFCFGAVVGWFVFEVLHNKAILIPCAIVGCLGIGHICYCQIFLNYRIRKMQSTAEEIYGSKRMSNIMVDSIIEATIIPEKLSSDSDHIDSDEEQDDLEDYTRTQTSLIPLVINIHPPSDDEEQTN